MLYPKCLLNIDRLSTELSIIRSTTSFSASTGLSPPQVPRPNVEGPKPRTLRSLQGLARASEEAGLRRRNQGIDVWIKITMRKLNYALLSLPEATRMSNRIRNRMWIHFNLGFWWNSVPETGYRESWFLDAVTARTRLCSFLFGKTSSKDCLGCQKWWFKMPANDTFLMPENNYCKCQKMITSNFRNIVC